MKVSFSPGGTKQNPVMNLRYYTNWSLCFVEDAYCIRGVEAYQGPISEASVTYSGRPDWNGSFQVALDVDTCLMENSSTVVKEGDGGRIQFTCTQDPAQDVTSWSGQQTVQGLSGSTKQTGSVEFMQGNATNRIGLLPFTGVELSSTCGMNWFKLTLLNH